MRRRRVSVQGPDRVSLDPGGRLRLRRGGVADGQLFGARRRRRARRPHAADRHPDRRGRHAHGAAADEGCGHRNGLHQCAGRLERDAADGAARASSPASSSRWRASPANRRRCSSRRCSATTGCASITRADGFAVDPDLQFSSMPFENQIELAWAASLVLVLIVLTFNITQAVSSAVRRSRERYQCPAAASLERPNGRKPPSDVAIDCKVDKIYYGNFQGRPRYAIPIEKGKITAFIGPSGCGKSTVLRCLNRMNDLVRGFRFEGHVHFLGQDIYAPGVDPVAVRRYIGMVFQQPNPFAMSIYRQRRLRPAAQRLQGRQVEAKVEQCAEARRAVGRGQGQAARRAACPSPAASSSGSASPAPWRPSRRCC